MKAFNFGNETLPIVFIIKNYDEYLNHFVGEFDHNKLFNFVTKYGSPILNNYHTENLIKVVNSRRSFSTLIMEFPELNSTLKDNFYSAIVDNRDNTELFHMVGKIKDNIQTTLNHEFEVKEEDLPVIIICEFGYNKKTDMSLPIPILT